MDNNNIQPKCWFCGSVGNFSKGIINNERNSIVFPANRMFSKGVPLGCDICPNCGTLVRIYVEQGDLDKFRK